MRYIMKNFIHSILDTRVSSILRNVFLKSQNHLILALIILRPHHNNDWYFVLFTTNVNLYSDVLNVVIHDLRDFNFLPQG